MAECGRVGCTSPAELQCGYCNEMYFCSKDDCFDLLHREPDRAVHRKSVSAYGTTSMCALHRGQELRLICEDPACGKALLCTSCVTTEHVGHTTTDIPQYMERVRGTLCTHEADLRKRRTAAEEECRVLEGLGVRCKDHLQQTERGYLFMAEGWTRSHIESEEEVSRKLHTQLYSIAGDVSALKAFSAHADDVVATCKDVCQLGPDVAQRMITQSQEIMHTIASIPPNMNRHRLVGVVSPHAELSVTLPECVASLHDDLAQSLRVGVSLPVECFDGEMHKVEVGEEDTAADLHRKVVSAVGLPEEVVHVNYKGEAIVEGEERRADRIVVTKTTKYEATTALEALGVPAHAESLQRVDDAKVACLLLQAEVATAIPDRFLSGAIFTTLDLTGTDLSFVTTVGESFLRSCPNLTTANISGLTGVTAIGTHFLSGCPSLTELVADLSHVTAIPDFFLHQCTALTNVDVTSWNSVTSIGNSFCRRCASLESFDLTGFVNVTAIQYGFLQECMSLRRLDLSCMSRLAEVGDGFLKDCRTLTDVDVSGLPSLGVIGNSFLDGCSALKTLNLCGFEGVTAIGTHFAYNCTLLQTVSISGLNSVAAIGKYCLAGCTMLKTLTITGLTALPRIEDSFASNCVSLTSLNIAGLRSVTVLGEDFLSGCPNLRGHDFTALSGVTGKLPSGVCVVGTAHSADGFATETPSEAASASEAEAGATSDAARESGAAACSAATLPSAGTATQEGESSSTVDETGAAPTTSQLPVEIGLLFIFTISVCVFLCVCFFPYPKWYE